MNAPRPIRILCPARWLLGIALFASSVGLARADRDPVLEHPFDQLGAVPGGVDAAAVINNPARQLLLSDSGRTMRKLLSASGVLTHTEHAWDALAQAFGASPDETIRSLLSKRVVIAWKGLDAEKGYADALDTRWTILCEVDPDYLRSIQAHLKPIQRRIERGQPVYAIEQGRYELVLLRSARADASAYVMLAPRNGSKLLDEFLALFLERQRGRGTGLDGGGSILKNRAQLADNLADDLAGGERWTIAWMLELDRFVHPDPGAPGPRASPALAGLVSTDAGGLTLSFATDLGLGMANDCAAPVGLLSAVGGDAIFAIAAAHTPGLLLSDEEIRGALRLDPRPAIGRGGGGPGARGDGALNGPGLVLLSRVPDDRSNDTQSPPYALTMMSQLGGGEDPSRSPAARVDALMHDLLRSIDPATAPSYQGRFPGAIRTHSRPTRISEPGPVPREGPSSPAWFGAAPKCSWIQGELLGRPAVIASFAPDGVDTAAQVRWISEAARNLGAIPDQPQPNGVITRGYLRPSSALALLGPDSSVDSALLGMIDRIEWNIVAAPYGLRGRARIELGGLSNPSRLGDDRSR